MASGLIGTAALAVNTWTQLGVALTEATVVNVRFANENATSVRVWVAISAGSVTDAGKVVTPGVPVQGYCPYEDTGIACSVGEKIFAKTDGAANVTVRAHGIPL